MPEHRERIIVRYIVGLPEKRLREQSHAVPMLARVLVTHSRVWLSSGGQRLRSSCDVFGVSLSR